jgi:branched-chain amino acid transport system substrate-binding protein
MIKGTWEAVLKYVRLFTAVCLAVSILSGCADLRGPAEERVYRAKRAGIEDPVIIGAAAPWRIVANLGYYREGLEMALDELNIRKVLGREVQIIWEDDESSVRKARTIAQNFAENPDITAVIGHYQSSITVPVSLIYQHYGLLMISATSTATKLTSREGMDLIFRNIPNDQQVGSQLADFSRNRGFERMIVLNEDNEFGNSLANAFENRAGQIGLNVVDRRAYDFSTGESQFKRIIEDWQSFYQFDALFLAGVVPHAAEFIVLAREMGMDIPIIGGDGLDSPQLWEIGGEQVNGVIVGTYFHSSQPGEEARKFVRAFNERYGFNPDTWAAQSYGSLKLLARAIDLAGTTNPEDVADALRSMKIFESVLGNTGFNDRGDVIERSITTKIVVDGKFEYLGFN